MADNPIAKHGKVAYVEIPALDPTISAAFYEAVFGFHLHPGKADRVGFEDGPSDLIGAFTQRRSVSDGSGVIPWIFVENLNETLERIALAGGETVMQPTLEGDTLLAMFRDPAGNLMGTWQFA